MKTREKVYYPYYPHKDRLLAFKILKIMSKKKFQSTKTFADFLGDKKPYSQKRITQSLERLKELEYCEEYNIVKLTDEKKTERNEIQQQTIALLTYEGKICQCPQKDSRRYFISKEQLERGLKTIKENKMKEAWIKSKLGTHIVGRVISSVTCPICFKDVHLKFDEEYVYKKIQERLWTLSFNGDLASLVLLKNKQLDDFIMRNKHNGILEMARIFLQTQRRELVDRLIRSLEITTVYTPDLSEPARNWRKQMRNEIEKINFGENQQEFVEYQNNLKQEILKENLLEDRKGRE